tara:strand:- start:3343 stop:4671 length:1329 start_codon:yes stop_codon:yes gene_type:complete
MTEFSTTPLEDLAYLSGGFAFKSKDYAETGRFILRTLNISDDGAINKDQAVYLPLDLCNSYKRFELQEHDTIFVMVGATLGKIGWVKAQNLPALLNQNMWLIRPKPNLVDPRFLNYAFRVASGKSLNWASGSARAFLKRDDYRKLNIPNPSIVTQRAISNLLGALDDKIENNLRINETLEEIARAIFKSWFVDFDPVHAKSTGNSLAHMDTETASLFPSSFGNDGLPVGWNLLSLGDVTEKITKGTTPTKRDLNEAKSEPCTINFLKVNNISDDGYFNQKSFEKIPFCVHNNQLKRSILKKDDVLYSIAGTIGRVVIIEDNILPSNTNQALAILRTKHELCPSGYLSLILKEDNFQKELHSNIVQAVQANLSLSMISAQKFVFPPAEHIGKIFSTIENILKMQMIKRAENQTLTELRDNLLPKLMSGEIRVNDAESEVEGII